MSIYTEIIEVGKTIKELDELLEKEEIDDQTYNDSLDLVKSSIENNVDDLTKYSLKLQAQINECDALKKHADGHKKRLENKLKRLNNFILFFMENAGINKLNGSVSEIKTTSSNYVDIYDMSKIPEEYMIRTANVTPDKNKIKEMIKSGTEIAGAKISSRKNLSYK